MAELVRGAPVPLFDRLTVPPADGAQSGSLLTAEQLQMSIARELSRLLNTRSPVAMADFANCTGTTLDYGVPDVGFLSPQSRADLNVLESAIQQSIEFFEPRLSQVAVRAEMGAVSGAGPQIEIAGMVSIGMKLRQLNFELQLDAGQAGLARTQS